MRLTMPMAVVVLLAMAGTARATPSARLIYARSSDATSCPDEAALHKAVGARFGYDPFFAWAKKTVVVQIGRDHLRYAARVELVDDQGVVSGSREIRSDEAGCADLFAAVALAISIALDASATIAASPEPPPAPSEPSAPLVPSTLPPRLPDEAIAAASAPSAQEHGPTVPRARAAPRPARPWLVGIDVLGVAGISKDPAPGLSLFAGRRAGALSLGLELQAEGSSWSVIGGRVESAVILGAVAPCVHFGPAFACALGELGWFLAGSSGAETTHMPSTAFGAAGGRLGVQAPVSSRFFLRFHADALVDLSPPAFQLDNTLVFTAPEAVVVFGAGAGTLFL